MYSGCVLAVVAHGSIQTCGPLLKVIPPLRFLSLNTCPIKNKAMKRPIKVYLLITNISNYKTNFLIVKIQN